MRVAEKLRQKGKKEETSAKKEEREDRELGKRYQILRGLWDPKKRRRRQDKGRLGDRRSVGGIKCTRRGRAN